MRNSSQPDHPHVIFTGESTILRASAPVSQGRSVCNDYRILGMTPPPVATFCNFTTLYTARYGVPVVGTKVFVRCSQMVTGFESGYAEFWAIVPAAT